jgi:hypothetical protein
MWGKPTCVRLRADAIADIGIVRCDCITFLAVVWRLAIKW